MLMRLSNASETMRLSPRFRQIQSWTTTIGAGGCAYSDATVAVERQRDHDHVVTLECALAEPRVNDLDR